MDDTVPYLPRSPSRSRHVNVRNQRCHLLEWGQPSGNRPTVVMLHGWMDVGASFQFVVDAMADARHVIAPDLRGFGLTEGPVVDSYWFPDFLGDLDLLLDIELPDQTIDLVGHSMGGNVAMLYAGLRPTRVRRLVNLEGFGSTPQAADAAWEPLTQWLDELQDTPRERSYGSLEVVARRMQENDHLLTDDRAQWLASRWARRGDDGRWTMLGEPAHKKRSPLPFRVEDATAIWSRIEAPLLWVEGDETRQYLRWGDACTREDFHRRLSVVKSLRRETLSPAGHMLHHDQPAALAALLDAHLA